MPVKRDKDLHRSIGANLQRLRKARGWTQEQFAERLNIQPSNLSRYETGSRGFSLDLVVAVADAFGVPLDALVKTVADGEPLGTDDEVLQRWRRLDEDGRAHLLWLLRQLTQ